MNNNLTLKRFSNFIGKFGTTCNSCDEDGKTLLFEVIERRQNRYTHHDILYLLSHDWDVNHQDAYGNTPLDVAIDMGNWACISLCLTYNPSEFTLYRALNTALQNFMCFRSDKKFNHIILELISSIHGISFQKNNKLLDSAIEGQAYPYIIPLLKAGYSLPNNIENHIPMYLYDAKDIDLFLSFYEIVERLADEFEFAEYSPIFLQKGKLQSCIRYEYLLYPHFPRKINKRIKKQLSLKNIRYMATHFLRPVI